MKNPIDINDNTGLTLSKEAVELLRYSAKCARIVAVAGFIIGLLCMNEGISLLNVIYFGLIILTCAMTFLFGQHTLSAIRNSDTDKLTLAFKLFRSIIVIGLIGGVAMLFTLLVFLQFGSDFFEKFGF